MLLLLLLRWLTGLANEIGLVRSRVCVHVHSIVVLLHWLLGMLGGIRVGIVLRW